MATLGYREKEPWIHNHDLCYRVQMLCNGKTSPLLLQNCYFFLFKGQAEQWSGEISLSWGTVHPHGISQTGGRSPSCAPRQLDTGQPWTGNHLTTHSELAQSCKWGCWSVLLIFCNPTMVKLLSIFFSLFSFFSSSSFPSFPLFVLPFKLLFWGFLLLFCLHLFFQVTKPSYAVIFL